MRPALEQTCRYLSLLLGLKTLLKFEKLAPVAALSPKLRIYQALWLTFPFPCLPFSFPPFLPFPPLLPSGTSLLSPLAEGALRVPGCLLFKADAELSPLGAFNLQLRFMTHLFSVSASLSLALGVKLNNSDPDCIWWVCFPPSSHAGA